MTGLRRLLALFAPLFLASCAAGPRIAPTYPGDGPMWERLARSGAVLALPPDTIAAIAPHHLVDGPELGAFWRGAAALDPDIVVVVGPNHGGLGPRMALPARAGWESPFGLLEPDRDLAERLSALLAAEGLDAVRTDAPFLGEHAIHAHAPFLRALLPKARFLPIVVHDLSAGEATALGAALDGLLPPSALVVASVDFSHFQVEPWADFHDEASAAAIEAFCIEGLYGIEVDSPASLASVMGFSKARGALRATALLRTNSQDKLSFLVPDSTSHAYYAFSKGPPASEPSVSVMATGDPGALSCLGVLVDWRWNQDGGPSSAFSLLAGRTISIPSGGSLLDSIRSQEDRFFAGADLVIFDIPPGTRVARRVDRGPAGIEVAIAGVRLGDLVSGPGALAAAVAEARGGAAFLVLVIDWEGRAADPALAEKAALAGASLVLGRRGGAALEVFGRGSSLVAPSLGAFGAAGAVLGATLYADRCSWRTLALDPASPSPRLDLPAVAARLGLPLASPKSGDRE